MKRSRWQESTPMLQCTARRKTSGRCRRRHAMWTLRRRCVRRRRRSLIHAEAENGLAVGVAHSILAGGKWPGMRFDGAITILAELNRQNPLSKVRLHRSTNRGSVSRHDNQLSVLFLCVQMAQRIE